MSELQLPEEAKPVAWAMDLTAPIVLASDYSALRTVAEQAIARVAELDRECNASMQTIAEERERVEAAEERVAELERERDDALCDCDDMMWQRRRADERAEAAEAIVARLRGALLSIKRKARALADDRDTHNRGLWDGCAAEADAALSTEQPKGGSDANR